MEFNRHTALISVARLLMPPFDPDQVIGCRVFFAVLEDDFVWRYFVSLRFLRLAINLEMNFVMVMSLGFLNFLQGFFNLVLCSIFGSLRRSQVGFSLFEMSFRLLKFSFFHSLKVFVLHRYVPCVRLFLASTAPPRRKTKMIEYVQINGTLPKSQAMCYDFVWINQTRKI